MSIIQELLATTDKARLRHAGHHLAVEERADGAGRRGAGGADARRSGAANVYRSYAATLAAYQAVDFDYLSASGGGQQRHRAQSQAVREKLWSDLGTGEPIVVSAMDGEEQEAESIAMKVSAARFERQAQWKDFAILYRSNHQSRILEQALRNLKITPSPAGRVSDKAEVRDILAYLRLLANDDDDPAFIRAATTPARHRPGHLADAGQHAASRELSLLAAARDRPESLLAPRQIEPLRTFTEFIRRMQWRARRGRWQARCAGRTGWPDPGRSAASHPVRAAPVRAVR